MKKLISITALLFVLYAQAQVKIGDNPNTINANSLLELESANKGFLPPRVALNNASSVSPLTGAVPSGMLVYCTGGALTDGYYYWNGVQWVLLAASETTIVSKTANATLLKTENFVLASNDITLTLPAVTSADNGLTITIKNAGTHTDLVTLVGNSGALIDNESYLPLPRWFSITVIAKDGAWYLKQRTIFSANTMEVSFHAPWQTIQEAIEFLNLHMWGPTVIKLGSESYDIDETQVIDLPYSLTIQGSSFGTTTMSAASGLSGKPMFRCVSECYFKMLQFDATSLAGYGSQPGEDAIRFVGSGTYNEVKDCYLDGFYNAILDSSNAELWVFETDISNANGHGILIHSGEDSVTVKVAETDFINCKTGIHLSKGNKATIQLSSGGYYNASSADTAIVYAPSTFTSFINISITGNSWNSVGKYIEGFDFTRSDGRDANAVLESNAGVGDSKPKCFINVVNSSTTTSLSSQNTWYKVNWGTGTTSETCKWTVNHNKITFQPTNRRNGWVIISGNVSANSNSQNITVGIVKNGSAGTQYGATTIRTVTSDQPFPFSIIVYLENIGANDYFELFAKNETSSGKSVKFQDLQWLVTTQ